MSDLQRGSASPALVFVHGLFGAPENWTGVARHLSSSVRVVAPRLPFHAAGRDDLDRYDSVPKLSEWLEDTLRQEGVRRGILVGHSLGGQIAIDLARRRPDLVEGLVLTGSAGLDEQNLFGSIMPRPDRTYVRERVGEVFFDRRHVTEEMLDEVLQGISERYRVLLLVRLAKASRGYCVRDVLPRLQTPTLLIWGLQDTITPPAVALEFREGIRQCRLEFLDRCGHAAPIEHPEQFGRLIRGFLAELCRNVPPALAAAPR